MRNTTQRLTLRKLGNAILACGLLLTAWASRPAQSQELTLRLDPEATRITFTLGATMHTVKGSASLSAGELRVDLAAKTMSGNITVDSRSLETGSNGRDKKMHADVLESEKFLKIVLTPERFEGTLTPIGTHQVTVYGTLEVHGESHPVKLPATVALEEGRGTASLTFSVPYVEWGMEDPSTFVLRVAKEVEVTVKAVASVEIGARDEITNDETSGDESSE